MGFPLGVDIKYGAFTLCCSTLLAHLDDLNLALSRDTRDLETNIIAQFEGVLRDQVYCCQPRNLEHAVQILLPRLSSERLRVATLNTDAARVVEAMMADIEQKAPNWEYHAEVERYRTWGERLSNFFYEGTPWPRTQKRLPTKTTMVFEYSDRKISPMAFYERYEQAAEGEPDENVILVRFSFEDDFSHYCAYPFFFFHEYASHVHGADSHTGIFDDGWMMFAIREYLEKNHDSLLEVYPLRQAQQRAIGEHFPSNLSTDLVKRYYFLAQNFQAWSAPWAQNFFKHLTWELAGYPLEQENPYWFADFMNRFHNDFHQRREDMRRMIENFVDVAGLYMGLTSV